MQTTTKYGGVTPTPINEVEDGIVLGIYGPGGIGKTTLAATVCDSVLGSPALYLNARGNPQVVRSYGDAIQVIDVKSFKHQEQIRQDMLKDPDCPYKSVIIDNVSEILSLDLRDRYGSATDIIWTMHSASTADILSLIRNWSDMSTSRLKLNVVFIMWETNENATVRGQELKRSELAFNKALQAQVPGIITWLGRLYIVTDKPPYTRCLDFRPIESMHVAKFQVDPNDARTADIPMEIYNPSLASIINTVKGGDAWPKDKHSNPRSK